MQKNILEFKELSLEELTDEQVLLVKGGEDFVVVDDVNGF